MLSFKGWFLPEMEDTTESGGERMSSELNIGELISLIRSIKKDQGNLIIAIDGPSGTGKSALVRRIQESLDCNVFHMDDFFLQMAQRTEERFLEPGGNIDQERFLDEVLKPVAAGLDFSYRAFDCRTMDFSGEIRVLNKRINLIEGVYSHHPALEGWYDLRIFLEADLATRKERILGRSGPEKYQIFLKQWIPLENDYFEKLDIRNSAQVVFSTTEDNGMSIHTSM